MGDCQAVLNGIMARHIEACVPAHAITTLHYFVSNYQSKNAASTLIIRHP